MKKAMKVFCPFLFFCWALGAAALPCHAQLISISILPFQDESDASVPPELLQKIRQEFKQKLTLSYKDVLARLLTSGALSDQANANVGQLAALGKQQGAKFVVRGGVLAVVSEKTGQDLKCRLELFSELIDTDSGAVSSLRAEGEATESPSPLEDARRWDSYTWNGPDFAKSALGQALSAAVGSLTGKVHAAALSPASQAQADAAAAGGQNQVSPAVSSPPSDPYQTDQELQQLIAQADSLISSGASASLDITPLQQCLESLRASMNNKLNLMQQAQDTTAVDQEIAQHKAELQDLVNSYTQQLAAAPPQTANPQDLTGEKKGSRLKFNELLDSTLNTLLKIQEIRAALGLSGGGGQGQPPPDEAGVSGFAPTEEQTSDVSGVVTDEAGNPVEGATVSDPETGASATTDGSGSYTISNLPGGRIADLQVAKGGASVASGRLELQPGKTGIADWVVRPSAGGAPLSASCVMPSRLIRQSSGSLSASGNIQGVVQDDRGRPVPRAMVSIKDVGVIRTDSAGRYAFVNVPQGSYVLTIQRPGASAQTQQAKVAGRKTTQPITRCQATALPTGRAAGTQVLNQAENTLLKGRVTDQSGKALGRAKVTIVYPGGALAAYSDGHGRYEVRNLKQGTYRVLASKAGYADSSATAELEKSKSALVDFMLKPSSSPGVLKAVASQSQKQPPATAHLSTGPGASAGHVAPTTQKTKPPVSKQTEKASSSQSTAKARIKTTPGSRQTQAPAGAKGGVRGAIIDAKTGSAVPGATVVVKGKPNTQADSAGQFSFGDLEPGSYSVSVKKSGYANGSGSFTVKPGETATVRVRLSPIVQAKPAATAIKKR
jgi:protocatechuate 3,4-dioxygenase beta subunit